MTSLVVLKVDFPEGLQEAATKSVAPEVMFAELLTNSSPATVKDTFNVETTLLDTHTFVSSVRAQPPHDGGALLSSELDTMRSSIVSLKHDFEEKLFQAVALTVVSDRF